MNEQQPSVGPSRGEPADRQPPRPHAARAHASPWPTRIARLLVLEMILWPGVLFLGATALIAWQVRAHPLVWPALLLATGLSLAVAVRQWGTMLHAARTPAQWSPPAAGEEVSPRRTGRGGTPLPPRAEPPALP
jgi:hypothetical protein